VIPGDRVRLAHPHRDLSPGAEGVVAAFSRHEDGVFVTVHFEGRDEVVPEAGLAVVHVRASPWGRLEPGQISRARKA
jgi:hypothetical protein